MTQNNSQYVVLITGCSSGFGLLTASHLATKQYTVIATMRNLEKKNALLSEANRLDCNVHIKQLDVTDNKSIQNCISEIADEFGHIDVLVNNAGYGIGGFFEDLSEDEIREQMETNFFGVQNLTRDVIPLMRQRKQGKIINISSVSGFSTSPCFGAYSTSKWALEAFSEGLHYELKMFGIDVLLIEPGSYNTKIFHENARYAKNFDNQESPYYSRSQYLRKLMMERLDDLYKEPEDIAHLVEKCIITKNPPFRNIPDLEAKVLSIMRRFLPFRIYSWIINKALYKNFHKV